MAISLNIDDITQRRLEELAQGQGLTVEAYLTRLVAARATAGDRLAASEIERELSPLLFSGPSLPPNFSRADIYRDHD